MTRFQKLDAEEQEILDAFESGALKRSADATAEIKLHQALAAATLQKDRAIFTLPGFPGQD